MIKDFAIFILTHGRPDKQLTLEALKKAGYNGEWYLVLDDTDTTIQQYIDNYGTDRIIVFNKNHYINHSDTGSNNPLYKCILYAKDATEDIARYMNLKSFIMADDDITNFRFRYIENDRLLSMNVCDINKVIAVYNDYMLESNIATLGFGNVYIYIGGTKALKDSTLSGRRFTYNFILRNTAHEVKWKSEMNEDSITPVLSSHQGQFWWQLYFTQFDMNECNAGADGGMSDAYAVMGKFKRYAHFLLYTPSSVRMIERFGSWTHTFNRKNAFPKLISDSYKRR